MTGEAATAIPQGLSSDLAKASTLPDVLKKSTINWNAVKKVDDAFDTIPTIKARGAELIIDKDNFPNPDKMREGTQISVGDKKTNLVDYVLQDEQLRVILQEGMRLNILNESDFKGMGLEPKNFQKGEVAGLQIPGLNGLQKSEAISLILHRLGESNPKTTSQFLDEASKLVLNPKDVTLLNKVGGTLSNQSLINALASGGREELNKYIVEQGYQPFAIDQETPMRRVMAKLVNEDYSGEGVTRIMKETTPFFADHKDVKLEDGRVVEKVGAPEYSALVDMRVAQAMTNAMMPPEFHLTIARIESQIAQTKDVGQAEDLRHAITRTKQKAYAALLNVYGSQDFQDDGKAFTEFGFTRQDQNDIMTMAKTIKESANFKETQDMTMFEANRASLAQITAEVTGLDPVKLQQITMAFPIEMTVESLREEARQNLLSEDIVEVDVRNKLSNSFILFIKDEGFQNNTPNLSQEQQDLLKTFFLKTYDTERSMLKGKGSLRNLKDADAPTKVKIGTPEAVNMGAKGLKLLFDRTITEQKYDFETYKNELIKGAAEVKDEKAGTVLEQGMDKKAADISAMRDEADVVNEAFDKRGATDEAIQMNERREQEDQGAVQSAAIEAEQRAQQELTTFLARTPAESLAITNVDSYEGVYVNELIEKIDTNNVSIRDIQDELNVILSIPKGQEWIFRGPIRGLKIIGLKGATKETYKQLESALVLARGYEAIPAENEDEKKKYREQFFVPLPPPPTPAI